MRTLLISGFLITFLACSPMDPKKKRDNRRFRLHPPPTGSIMPQTPLYDELGQRFDHDSLRGRHAVLIGGCLT